MCLKLFKINLPSLWLDNYPEDYELVTVVMWTISFFLKVYKVFKVDQHSLQQADYPEYNEIVTLVRWTVKHNQISHSDARRLARKGMVTR